VNIGKALEALLVANPDFEVIEKSRDVFCPFEAIGMVRQEIRHGHYLAYCLDPQRPHGFGAECLRALMRAASYARRNLPMNDASGQITPLDVHLMDFEKAQIRREWRKIDLLAVVNQEKLVVAIELKIDASEHSGQLRRYKTLVEEQWPMDRGWRHLFLYLTKSGNDASEDGGGGWIPLHLQAVAIELESVLARQHGAPDARVLLQSYLSMLRRHHLKDDNLEALAAKIWSQHKEALEFLMDRRPDGEDGVFAQIYDSREEAAARMSDACGLDVVPDDSTKNIVRFAIKNWDDLPHFLTAQDYTTSNRLVLLELQRSGDKHQLRVRFVLGRGDQDVRMRFLQALADAGQPTTKRNAITTTWTRLGTQSISIGEDDEGDTAASYDRVLQMLERYAKEIVRGYDEAFKALR